MIVYWDTSALVGVYITDACTRAARKLYQQMKHPISSWLCFAETHAALCAARDLGRITTGEYQVSVRRFEDDWGKFRRIPLRDTTAAELRRLFKYHSLRGADATHLATALVVRRHLTTANEVIIFACHDSALAKAAEAEQLQLAWTIN